MTARVYLFVGGPAHGRLEALPRPAPSYVLPVVKALPDTLHSEEPFGRVTTITYLAEKFATVDPDGTAWLLHVLESPEVAALGPFARTRLLLGAAMRRLPGVELGPPNMTLRYRWENENGPWTKPYGL